MPIVYFIANLLSIAKSGLDPFFNLPDGASQLLRFLQEREFERVGGITAISVDVRVIAATNRELEGLVKEGRFREDLYHRLNVVAITLPPLRERTEDIPALSAYFLQQSAKATRRNICTLTREAEESLAAYDWPGNVRELANVIERAVVLGSNSAIGLEDLPSRIAGGDSIAGSESFSYRERLKAARKQLILEALSKTHGNRAAAAKLLDLEAKYLLKLIKSLGIK